MRFSVVLPCVVVVLCFAFALPALPQSCEPTASARGVLEQVEVPDDARLPAARRQELKLRLLRKALSATPADISLHEAYQAVRLDGLEINRAAVVAEYEQLLARNLRDPVFLYLASNAQSGRKTKDANRRAAQPRGGENRTSRGTLHPKDLPPFERPAAANTGDPNRDGTYQQHQQKMFAKQEQDRRKLQQKQDQEHQRLTQQNASEARRQQVEQRHQQQTERLQQRHVSAAAIAGKAAAAPAEVVGRARGYQRMRNLRG
jgi:hypothetical protein